MPTGPDAAHVAAMVEEAARRLARARSELDAANDDAKAATVTARQAGWAQEAISARLGVTRQTVVRWLREDAHRG